MPGSMKLALYAVSAMLLLAGPASAAGPDGPVPDVVPRLAQAGGGGGPMHGHRGPGAAGAPMMGPHAQRHFESLDRNGDGAIERDEFAGHQDAMFDFLDGDGNGTVSREEFVNVPPPMPAGGGARQMAERRAERFNELDRNRDGRLTAEEFRAIGDRAFALRDLDDDGRLTPGELGHGPRSAQ